MMRFFFLLAPFILTGCPHKTVLRDAKVYEAELNQYDNWAVKQASFLRAFIDAHCACESEAEGPTFETTECEQAADYVLTIEARHDWHKQMSLYNASLIDERPPEAPPEIAPLVCPLPPPPAPPTPPPAVEGEE